MIGVVFDVWREARSRRWFILLFGLVTVVLLSLLLFLRLDVVDGALTATRMFGFGGQGEEIVPVDMALRPVFVVFSRVLFYGGLMFGILACSEFAPSLLAPGRIELLLSFPVSRPSLLIGTFVAIGAAAAMFATYAALGVTLVFWGKTGVLMTEFLVAGALAVTAFLPIYAAMLLCSVVVRSTALAVAAGASVFVLGLFASYREAVIEAFSAQWPRLVVGGLLRLFPPLITLANDPTGRAPEVVGTLVLGLAMLAAAIFVFEGKDY